MSRALGLNEAQRLLSVLRPDTTRGFVHLLAYPEPGPNGCWPEHDRALTWSRPSVDLALLHKLSGMALRLGLGLAYGVIPHETKSGILGEALAVWVDADDYRVEGGWAEIRRRLTLLGAPPSIIIRSGRGHHLLWLLDRAVSPQEASALSEALQEALGPELDRCHAPDRHLRLPGTWHHGAACWARVMSWSECRWAPGQLKAAARRCAPAGHPRSVPRVQLNLGGVKPPSSPPAVAGDARLVQLWRGEGRTTGDLSASGYDMAFALALLRRGWGSDDVEDLVGRRRIGDGKAVDYAARTVLAATRVVGQRESRAATLVPWGSSAGTRPPRSAGEAGRCATGARATANSPDESTTSRSGSTSPVPSAPRVPPKPGLTRILGSGGDHG